MLTSFPSLVASKNFTILLKYKARRSPFQSCHFACSLVFLSRYAHSGCIFWEKYLSSILRPHIIHCSILHSIYPFLFIVKFACHKRLDNFGKRVYTGVSRLEKPQFIARHFYQEATTGEIISNQLLIRVSQP